MPYTVTALTEELPQARGVIRALRAAHPDMTIHGASRGSVVRLRDEDKDLFVSVEAPQAVEVPGEVGRLLGTEAEEALTHNAWWVDVRAPADRPEAAEAAHRCAEALVDAHGGHVWTGGPSPSWVEALPEGRPEHPSAVAETPSARVLAVSTPVVTLSAAVADALTACGQEDRALQMLTPTGACLTHALREALATSRCRWVAEGPHGGHYDGITGTPLVWDDEEGFTPRRDGAPPALARSEGEPGLVMELHAVHRPTTDLMLGHVLALTTRTLCGEEPTGWATNEPALSAWDPVRVTELCRSRAPRPTRTVVTGPSFTGTLRATRVPDGVKESVSLIVPEGDALEAVPELLAELANTLRSMSVRRVPGAGDTLYRPVLCGAAVPVGLALGPDAVAEVGTEHALAAPIGAEPVGARWSPTLWFSFEETPTKRRWHDFRELLAHLSPPVPEKPEPAQG